MDYADLISLISQLPDVNLKLDNPNLIADMTWFSVSESAENLKVVYVFRSKADELLIAKNGKVSDGAWDFIPNTNSVFVKLGNDKKLYNAVLLKGHYLILRQDGSQDFILLVNQAYYQKILEVAPKKIWELMIRDLKVFMPAQTQSEVQIQEKTVATEQIDEPTTEVEPVQVEPIQAELTQTESIAEAEEETFSQPVVEEPQSEEKPEAEEVDFKAYENSEMLHHEPVEEEPEVEIIEELRPEEEPAKAQEGSHSSLLDKLRATQSDDEEEDEDEKTFPLGEKKPTLNDLLKQKLHKEEQSTLLDKLSEKVKKKD